MHFTFLQRPSRRKDGNGWGEIGNRSANYTLEMRPVSPDPPPDRLWCVRDWMAIDELKRSFNFFLIQEELLIKLEKTKQVELY